MDDILIKGGSVVDGTGAPARTADVAIRDGRVTTIKENRTDSAERVIDAEGKIVTPCFIDIHTHSDFTLPLNPKADGKIRQGVTTEVIGNCGFSVAPALPEKVEELRAYLSGMVALRGDEFRELRMPGLTLRAMAMGMEDRAPNDGEFVGDARKRTERWCAWAFVGIVYRSWLF